MWVLLENHSFHVIFFNCNHAINASCINCPRRGTIFVAGYFLTLFLHEPGRLHKGLCCALLLAEGSRSPSFSHARLLLQANMHLGALVLQRSRLQFVDTEIRGAGVTNPPKKKTSLHKHNPKTQPGAVVACTLDGGARNKCVPLQLCCLQEDEQRGVQ